MVEHRATVRWSFTDGDFIKGKYSRAHTWLFDGGLEVPGSSSPHVVRLPFSDPAAVDPEEAFVAAIASCHMLTFLYAAGKRGFEIQSYEDAAVGTMTKNEHGVPWVSRVTLDPKIVYGAARTPTHAEEAELHHVAHHECYIANSVKTEILVQGFS